MPCSIIRRVSQSGLISHQSASPTDCSVQSTGPAHPLPPRAVPRVATVTCSTRKSRMHAMTTIPAPFCPRHNSRRTKCEMVAELAISTHTAATRKEASCMCGHPPSLCGISILKAWSMFAPFFFFLKKTLNSFFTHHKRL